MVLPMWTMLSAWSKQSHGCSCPGCKATNHTGTLRNLLNPCLRSYTNTRRNSSEPSGTFRTLPLEPTPTRAGTLQNLPRPSGTNLSEPSGTYLRNLHHFTPEPSGTFRNLPLEPTPAHAGTLRNSPEPSSGTCSCDPHRHTPELIWAEDPISLRCWGKKVGRTHCYLFIALSLSLYEACRLPQKKSHFGFWKILEGFCTGALRNFVCYVHRTAQQLCLLSAPEPSGTSWAICTGTLRTSSAIRNPPEPDRSRPHQASASEPSGTLSAMCTGQLSNFVCYLHRNHPELHGPSAPGPSELHQPSGTLQNLTVRDLIRHLHRNPPELCLLCAPDSWATLSAICTGTIRNFMGHLDRDPPNFISHPEPSRTWPFETSSGICIGTLRNFVCYVHRTAQQLCLLSAPEPSGTSWAIYTGTLRTWSTIRNPPASQQPSTPEPSRTSSAFCPEPSAPEPFGTLSAICTRTLRNFISFLPRNPPEPHQPSAPEPSGTLSCTGTLRNLISNLHRKAPEPSGTFSGTWCCSCTGSHQSFSGLKTP